MKNYFEMNGKKYDISPEDAQKVAQLLGIAPTVSVGDLKPGDIFTAGGFEFVLLEQTSAGAACVLRGTYGEEFIFGDNNNYNGSNVDKICEEFADKLEKDTGAQLVNFSVNLAAANGMTDYGTITRRASLLTLEQLQRYAPTLANCSPSLWWWLATACGSDTWGGSSYALCVPPRGIIGFYGSIYLSFGVRPFCIFPASLSVSL